MPSSLFRPPWRLYAATVVEIVELGPGFLRVVLGGDDVREFVSSGVGDEYVRLFLPPADGGPVQWPVPVGDGWEHPDPARPCVVRTYTVRRHDAVAGTVWIDVARHPGGVAAAWAERALPGSPVVISSPTGLYARPPQARWQVLVTDATGLPAACRLMEETPAEVATRVVLEVSGPEQRLDLSGLSPTADVSWVYGGNGVGPSRLEHIVRSILSGPLDDGFIWSAGETTAIRGIRRYLRHERWLPPSAYKVVGYWTQDSERWFTRYAALDDGVRAELEALWASGGDDEEIEDRVTARLERLGL